MDDDKTISFPQGDGAKAQAKPQDFDASPGAFEKVVVDAIYKYTAAGMAPANAIVCLEIVKHRVMHMLDDAKPEQT